MNKLPFVRYLTINNLQTGTFFKNYKWEHLKITK